jgi:hypothetical protein
VPLASFAFPQGPRFPPLLTTHAARELTLDAAQAARNSRSATRPLDRNQIKKLLDSRNEREVLDGLRRVISVRPASHPSTTPK